MGLAGSFEHPGAWTRRDREESCDGAAPGSNKFGWNLPRGNGTQRVRLPAGAKGAAEGDVDA